MEYISSKVIRKNINPLELFRRFRNKDHPFLLYSSLNNYGLGRYSFMGFEPFLILKAKGKNVEIIKENKTEKITTNALYVLRDLLDKYKLKRKQNALPFSCGAVGYIGYDFGFLLEDIRQRAVDDLGLPDLYFGFYDTSICFDHQRDELIISSIAPSADIKIKEIISALGANTNCPRKTPPEDRKNNLPIHSNLSKNSYLNAIKKVKQYIKYGDIYQLNLSQRFQTQTQKDAFDLFKKLTSISPSAFSTFFDAGEFSIISSSPETFLKVDRNNIVYTRPMKGTRPRASTKKKDTALKNELLNSEKDKAELMMIVDLLRNDLGRVCLYDSIKVASLRNLEKYSTVFQTTASIRGRLHPKKDRIDLIKACFPGGSITGCPKIRAMEIIEELEPTKRGIYTGSFGYFDFSGNMELNILIRTILKKYDKIYFQAGGGIVADSIPEDEYQETLIKARAVIKALS